MNGIQGHPQRCLVRFHPVGDESEPVRQPGKRARAPRLLGTASGPAAAVQMRAASLGGNGSGAPDALVQRTGGAIRNVARRNVRPGSRAGARSIATAPTQAKIWQAGILPDLVPVLGWSGQFEQG